MRGRPSHLLQSAGGEANRILLASALSSMRIICPNGVSRRDWIIAVSLGCFVSLRTSSFRTNWYHLMRLTIKRTLCNRPCHDVVRWRRSCVVAKQCVEGLKLLLNSHRKPYPRNSVVPLSPQCYQTWVTLGVIKVPLNPTFETHCNSCPISGMDKARHFIFAT